MSRRVLVIFEPGRAGAAALDTARELVAGGGGQLTVVCVADQTAGATRCGCSAVAYNDAVIDAARDDLQRARERLGEAGQEATFELLIEGRGRPLHDLTARDKCDLVLLPARRRPLRSFKRPAVDLSSAGSPEVRVVQPAQRRLRHS